MILVYPYELKIKSKSKKRFNKLKRECYKRECFHMDFSLANNCIYNCIDKECYFHTFKFHILETGENNT